jgi:hypothetical protein
MAQRGARGLKATPARKDRQDVQGTRVEIAEEIRSGPVGPSERKPNRAAARGDRDRTGRHHDQGRSRDETLAPPGPDREYPSKD